jgi:hypothetical protein
MDVNGQMHPGTVAVMVTELEEDPNVLASTGYPLDVPPPDATIWAWVMCQFRYNCLSQFVSNHSDVCWGGAMMMRKADFDDDTCEVKSRWENGGYSDDMLVAACAADYGRAIATPLRAIFPNGMKKDVTFSDTWDFFTEADICLDYIWVMSKLHEAQLFALRLCHIQCLTCLCFFHSYSDPYLPYRTRLLYILWGYALFELLLFMCFLGILGLDCFHCQEALTHFS